MGSALASRILGGPPAIAQEPRRPVLARSRPGPGPGTKLILRDHLTTWLHEHGIERDAEDVVAHGELDVAVIPLGDHAGEIARVVSDIVGVTLVGAVFAAVYVAAHGTHILVHPWTGVPLAMLTAGASAIGYKAVDGYIREQIMAYGWGNTTLTALSAILSEQGLRNKIADSRKELAHQIAVLLRNGPQDVEWMSSGSESVSSRWTTLSELQHAVSEQFQQLVTQVTRDLGVLEEFRWT